MPGRPFDLLVLGDCNPDLIITGEELEPRFGQVERLVDGAELTIGGSGSIVACGAARLGLRTAFVGVVGDDLFGRFMVEALAQRGVDTGGIVVDRTQRTGLTVVLARRADRAMLTFPGTSAALTAGAVDPELLMRTRHIHVSSYFVQSSLAQGLLGLFEAARGAGVSSSIDPNWDPTERWDGGLRELLDCTDVFLPNAEEAIRISQSADAESAARELAIRGSLVAVKLGADGALAVDGEASAIRCDSLKNVEPVDTVGAGDSFDAGVIAGLLSGWGTKQALALGCACGALSTRAAGGTSAQPTLDEAIGALGEQA